MSYVEVKKKIATKYVNTRTQLLYASMKHTWDNSMNVQIVVKSLSVEKRLHLNLRCLSKCDFDEQILAIREKKELCENPFLKCVYLGYLFMMRAEFKPSERENYFINKTKQNKNEIFK